MLKHIKNNVQVLQGNDFKYQRRPPLPFSFTHMTVKPQAPHKVLLHSPFHQQQKMEFRAFIEWHCCGWQIIHAKNLLWPLIEDHVISYKSSVKGTEFKLCKKVLKEIEYCRYSAAMTTLKHLISTPLNLAFIFIYLLIDWLI